MSALVYDHLAGMAATQVYAGLLAAISVTQNHQSPAPRLSLLTGLPAMSRQPAAQKYDSLD